MQLTCVASVSTFQSRRFESYCSTSMKRIPRNLSLSTRETRFWACLIFLLSLSFIREFHAMMTTFTLEVSTKAIFVEISEPEKCHSYSEHEILSLVLFCNEYRKKRTLLNVLYSVLYYYVLLYNIRAYYSCGLHFPECININRYFPIHCLDYRKEITVPRITFP